MSPIKSCIIAVLLVSSTVLSAYIDSQGGNLGSVERNQQFSMEGSARLLQAISTSDKSVAAELSKAITEANALRQSKGLPLLGINPSIGTIISQWFKALKSSLALTTYLQLYGIVNVQIQTYPSIPFDYITGVLQGLSLGLYDGTFNQVGSFTRGVDGDNYEVIMIFQGGDNAQAVDYSTKNIQDVVTKIKAKSTPDAPAGSNKSPEKSGSTPSYSPSSQVKQSVPVVSTPAQSQSYPPPPSPPAKSEVAEDTSASKTTSTVSQSQTSISATVTQQSQTSQTSQSNQNNQNAQSSPLNSESSTSSASLNTQVTQNNAPPLPATTPAPTQSTPPSNPTSTSPTQTNQISTYQAPVDNPPKIQAQTPSPPTSTITPTTAPVQTPPTATAATLPPTIINRPTPPVVTPQPQTTTTTAPKSTPPSYTTPAAPGFPLISQTTFTNTTSFAGITLSHGLPTTFLKNEIFSFKGKVTTPNPSGTTVSVIFTRVSDQLRLGFSQWVAANTSSFRILANLNMSGVYYLSVFAGSSGFTALQQYTIAPGFIGQIVSRPPTPLSNASINLINNDLWVNWTYSDVKQPALTLIIFSQGGFSVQFLLSNYETSFKMPYEKFWAFNVGPTDVQITQAFSSNESGNSRTSDFSAPFNIIFNATNHNYAIVKSSSQFEPIPLRVPAGVVKVVGPASGQLENRVILQTPSKSFIQYKLDSNSSNQYVEKGFSVNLTITLNERGVYILEVNDAGGEAIVNIPLYNGDIYPLVPDFLDLTPSYIDLAALNQPSLIQDRRSLVLDMLNSIRSNYGVGNLYLDKNLNSLAQNYSAVMVQSNFISHIDLQGNTPSQRAAAAGILEGVSENLAMNNNLTQAQLMLQRSPAHLQNMVNPDWTRVGLGIVQNGNKFYFLSQEFSSRDMTLNPLSSAEIAGIQSNLVSYLLGKYNHLQNEDKVLSSRLNAYQQMTNRPYIITYLQGFGYRNVAVANVQVNYNSGKFMNLIKNGNNFEPTSNTFIQVAATVMYSNGNLQIFAAYV